MKNKDIDQKVDQLIKLLDIPEWDKEIVKQAIYENLKQRLGIRVIEELPSEQLNHLAELIDANEDEAFDFMFSAIPSFDTLVDDELEKFKIDFQAGEE